MSEKIRNQVIKERRDAQRDLKHWDRERGRTQARLDEAIRKGWTNDAGKLRRSLDTIDAAVRRAQEEIARCDRELARLRRDR